MTTPNLKRVDQNDSAARFREKINSNFGRCGAGSLATGFVAENFNRDIVVDYSTTNRTITLTGTFKAYHEGILISELTSGWVSSAHDSPTLADGVVVYFLRHNGTQFLFDTDAWDITNDILIASVQIRRASGVTTDIIVLRECHGASMSGVTHKHLHYELGTGRMPNGAIFTNYVTDSTTAADRRPYVSDVRLTDEDLETDVEALSTNSYTQRYLNGSTGTRTFLTGQTDIVKLNGNIPKYNQWTGSTWTDTDFPVNAYGAIFVVAIPAAKKDGLALPHRIMFVQPQKVSTDITVIQALTTADLVHGESSSLVAEYNFIGKIIIRYFSNNWRIISVEELLGNKIQQSSGMVGYGLATSTTDGLMSSTQFNLLESLGIIAPQITTEVASATADKGTYTGSLLTGHIFDLILTNGNTAASPTITIGAVTYSISGMPTVAKISTSANQIYRLKKTADTTLTFVGSTGYEQKYTTEYCVSGEWTYERLSDGTARAFGSISGIALTSSGAFGTGELYIHNGTFAIPSGFFNATPKLWANHGAASAVYGSLFGYATSATAGGVQIIKSNTTGTTVTEPIIVLGTWK